MSGKLTGTLSEPKRRFLQALVDLGGINVRPPALRENTLHAKDRKARQWCARVGYAFCTPGSHRWNITDSGRAALQQKGDADGR